MLCGLVCVWLRVKSIPRIYQHFRRNLGVEQLGHVRADRTQWQLMSHHSSGGDWGQQISAAEK